MGPGFGSNLSAIALRHPKSDLEKKKEHLNFFYPIKLSQPLPRGTGRSVLKTPKKQSTHTTAQAEPIDARCKAARRGESRTMPAADGDAGLERGKTAAPERERRAGREGRGEGERDRGLLCLQSKNKTSSATVFFLMFPVNVMCCCFVRSLLYFQVFQEAFQISPAPAFQYWKQVVPLLQSLTSA